MSVRKAALIGLLLTQTFGPSRCSMIAAVTDVPGISLGATSASAEVPTSK